MSPHYAPLRMCAHCYRVRRFHPVQHEPRLNGLPAGLPRTEALRPDAGCASCRIEGGGAGDRTQTASRQQLQIDFCERHVEIGGSQVKAFVFVATLGYSRRLHVRAFRNEKQEHWFVTVHCSCAPDQSEKYARDPLQRVIARPDPNLSKI